MDSSSLVGSSAGQSVAGEVTIGQSGSGEMSTNGNTNANRESNGNGHCANGNPVNSDSENDHLSQQFETLKMMTGSKTPFELHSRRDRETIRLIGQHLIKLGLERSARELVNESGCELDHPTATKFRAAILEGNWDAANDLLVKLRPFTPSTKAFYLMRYWILEQKFLEALEDQRNLEALQCLRNEIVPLKFRKKKITELCHYFMLNSIDELRHTANWLGKGQQSRTQLLSKVQKRLPPEIMLPPDRLTRMFTQAFEYQRSNCLFHNQEYFSAHHPGELSLLADHCCDRDALPSECTQTLEEHVDEVWFCAFSKCGRYLATASKDRSVTVWDVCTKTFALKLKHKFKDHPFQVAVVSWSPDSNWLLTLGSEGTSEFWVWSIQDGQVKYKINKDADESITTAAWHANSRVFVVAGLRGHFHSVRLDLGSIVDTWEGVRVQALVCKNDNRTVLAADSQCRIRAFVFGQNYDELIIREEHDITTFCCDETFRYAAINVAKQSLHLWDIRDRVLLRKLQGSIHGFNTIGSCFGGLDQNFIASGCEENNRVIIWNRNHNNPIIDLRGHTKAVNCVSWNLAHPQMLASASDDATVKIWCSRDRLDHNSQHLSQASKMESLRLTSVNGGSRLENSTCSPKASTSRASQQEDGHKQSAIMDYTDSEFEYSSDEEIEALLGQEIADHHQSQENSPNNFAKDAQYPKMASLWNPSDFEELDEDDFPDDGEGPGKAGFGHSFHGGISSRPTWFNKTRCEQNPIVGYMVHLNERLRQFRQRRSVKRNAALLAQAKQGLTLRQAGAAQEAANQPAAADPLPLICDSSESEESPSSSSTSPSSNSP